MVLKFLDAKILIGLGFAKLTNRAVIDLDKYSNCHPRNNPDEYNRMREALEEVGLCSSLLVQSSGSGGTHLYYPLPDAYPTYHVAALIQTTLIDAGFEIANGQLEIFPNCKGYAKRKGEYIHYKRHRLPLQPGVFCIKPRKGGISIFTTEGYYCPPLVF